MTSSRFCATFERLWNHRCLDLQRQRSSAPGGRCTSLRPCYENAGLLRSNGDVLDAWQSHPGAPDIIDFRFPSLGTVIEVKSTLGGRTHHIQGHSQITIPGDYKAGYLASLVLVETRDRTGKSCNDLCEAIRTTFRGPEGDQSTLKLLFERKLEARGNCTRDSHYSFDVRDAGICMFPFPVVPRPEVPHGVSDVEWTADFSEIEPLDSETASDVMKLITS